MAQSSEARSPGRPRAEDSLSAEDILRTALRAFATYGYDGVSVRTLNRELGVSHNLIHQRFGSKRDLWQAAVDHGFGTLQEYIDQPLEDEDEEGLYEDPLNVLELGIRRFLIFSAECPEVLGLMNMEGSRPTDRIEYIFDNYVWPMQSTVGMMLDQLADDGMIRRIPLRTFHFLVTHGGGAPFTLVALAEHFDPASPLASEQVEAHAALVAKVIVEGMRLR